MVNSKGPSDWASQPGSMSTGGAWVDSSASNPIQHNMFTVRPSFGNPVVYVPAIVDDGSRAYRKKKDTVIMSW